MHVAGTAALVLAFALHSAPLAGQRLLYGDRIRVRPPAPANEASGTEWTDGSVIRLAGDTLWYESPAGSLTPLLLSQNDVLAGRNHRNGGIILGGLVGAAVGAGIAYRGFEPRVETDPVDFGDAVGCFLGLACSEPTQSQVNTRTGDTLSGAWSGAVVGILLGWLVGKSVWTWTAVDVTQLTASAESFGIGLRYRVPHAP